MIYSLTTPDLSLCFIVFPSPKVKLIAPLLNVPVRTRLIVSPISRVPALFPKENVGDTNVGKNVFSITFLQTLLM